MVDKGKGGPAGAALSCGVRHDTTENDRTALQPLALAPWVAIFSSFMIDKPDPTAMAERRDGDGDGDDPGTGLGVATRTRTRTKQPTPYRVLLLNDDYTPMEFVVLVLQRFFRMNMEEATRVMLHVHQKGVG